ncbi:MAG: glycosyltransferase family 4 protein [archaeon]|nr:glycosyltransferase family 4 protein [archaeon]MCP8314431.1 glycosyltransferase family 4 protein [archaeon]
MRIVQVAPFYHPIQGGVETVVKNISEYLSRKGFDVYIVTYNRDRLGNKNILRPREEINGVKVIRLKPTILYSHGSFSEKLHEVLSTLRPSTVHAHVWRHPHSLIIPRLKRKLGFRAILHGHSPFFPNSSLIEKLYYKIVDHLGMSSLSSYDQIICLTPHEKAVYMEWFRAPDERTIVIPNGISDLLLYDSSDAESIGSLKKMIGCESKDIILYLGRISKIKNLCLLIEAIGYIIKELKDTMLVLAGPDEGFVREALKLAESNDTSRYIKYLGSIGENWKELLYAASNVFALPSLYEPFGISLLEAQAFGKPAVITGYGGQEYTCQVGRTGLWSPPRPKPYSEAILRLLTDRSLYRKMSYNARLWADAHAWSRILPLYEKIYGSN